MTRGLLHTSDTSPKPDWGNKTHTVFPLCVKRREGILLTCRGSLTLPSSFPRISTSEEDWWLDRVLWCCVCETSVVRSLAFRVAEMEKNIADSSPRFVHEHENAHADVQRITEGKSKQQINVWCKTGTMCTFITWGTISALLETINSTNLSGEISKEDNLLRMIKRVTASSLSVKETEIYTESQPIQQEYSFLFRWSYISRLHTIYVIWHLSS